MFYVITISLSLAAAGIFFAPAAVLAAALVPLILVDAIYSVPRKGGFLKTLGLLTLTVLPLSLVKILSIKEGVEFDVIGNWKVYSEGLRAAGLNALRVYDLFCVSWLLLKVIFPIEKFREKYRGLYPFRVIFESIELFPELLEPLGELFRTRKAGAAREGFAKRTIRTIDEIYVKTVEGPDRK